MTLYQILNEEIYGNTATVYFRANEEKLRSILSGNYENVSHMDFKNHDKGLYTVFNINSTLQDLDDGSKDFYGPIIVQAKIKGLNNFFFTSYNLYKQYVNPNADKDTWIDEQKKKFGLDNSFKIGSSEDKELTDYHNNISLSFERKNYLPGQQLPQRLSSKAQKKMNQASLKQWDNYLSKQENNGRVKGIVYHGGTDGYCVLLYNYKSCIPVSYSLDDGKTWSKNFDGKEIKQSVKESGFKFNGNDNIDSYSKQRPDVFLPDKDENIDCSDNNLTSLKGAPQKVTGDFWCYRNQLTSLEGAPQEIIGEFSCSDNNLTSLKGAPQKVGGDFWCHNNQLTSLEGAPQEVSREFDCKLNKLTSLKGAPQKVGGHFNCSYNKLTSLEGAPREVGGEFYCDNNKLTSLKGAPQKVGYGFICSGNKGLTAKAILDYLKTARVGENIKTDFGNFRTQQMAIEKLSKQLNEDYFPY